MTTIVLLFAGLGLGTIVGALGTLTGIGGGFLLMPALLWAFPGAPPGTLALTSLTLVLFNSLSGTVLAVRRDRIRWPTALAYLALTLGTVWWGGQLQSQADRSVFDPAFGVLLLMGAGLLSFRRAPEPLVRPSRRRWFASLLGAPAAGLVAGFFGVGGGFLLVPWFVHQLRMPLAEATATSQLIVGVGAFAALIPLLGHHSMAVPSSLLAGLVAGVLVGAPVGSALGERLKSRAVLGILAAVLALVGLRFLGSRFF